MQYMKLDAIADYCWRHIGHWAVKLLIIVRTTLYQGLYNTCSSGVLDINETIGILFPSEIRPSS